MKTPAILIVFMFVLICCHKTRNKKSHDNNETEFVNTTNSDEDVNSAKWTHTFGKNTLGILHTGEPVLKALELLDKLFIIRYDSIETMEFSNQYEYYYSIYKNDKLIFTLYPGFDDKNKGLIVRFDLYSDDYKSDKGIGIGNTVTDLKERYKLTEAYFAYDLGLFLFAEDFEGSFGLKYESYSDVADFNFEQPIPENIPGKSIIDKIVIL